MRSRIGIYPCMKYEISLVLSYEILNPKEIHHIKTVEGQSQ